MKYFYFFSMMLFASQVGIYAQDFQGEATYFSKTTVNMDFGGRQIPEDRKKEIMQRMKEANERTYILTFDKSSSIYKEEERLEQPGNGRGGGRFGMMGGAGGDYYKDVREGRYLVKNELFGKIFLVDDELPKLEWKLGGESKQIGNYTAFKATAIKTIKRPNMRAIFRRGGDNNENQESEFTEKEIEIVAWYAPDVPVNQGPGEYWGLPGLILEVKDDVTVILCTKLVLNPTEKKEIKAPNKGKTVTQEEYDKISKDKMAEMRENFRGGRGGGNRGGGGRP
ncbi:GLPGLI family protein [Arenibacter sp. F20364]|uniref:GLPGLI family protein n=1 Tax=Arenibacter sp. F20364 TaxID=2926415 RepID=UPI001FF3F9EA|nr:GLPGLI family protein [Arenibacter sp. F20364]MCK0191263.1 GLPGLI family protein [Arenibacter sp. F20364]